MRCPVCHKPSIWKDNEWRPFCSEICQQKDLGRWMLEDYRIPVSSLNADEAESLLEALESYPEEYAEK
jgi:hypothetical protein